MEVMREGAGNGGRESQTILLFNIISRSLRAWMQQPGGLSSKLESTKVRDV